MSGDRPSWEGKEDPALFQEIDNCMEDRLMFAFSFAKAALERALRAAAWSLSSLLIADGTNLLNTNWADRLSVAGMAGLLSLLASVAGSQVGGTGPSLANEAIVPPAKEPAQEGLIPPRSTGDYRDTGSAELWVIAGALVVLALVAVFGRP